MMRTHRVGSHTPEESRRSSDLGHRVEGLILAAVALLALMAGLTRAPWAATVRPWLAMIAGLLLLIALVPHAPAVGLAEDLARSPAAPAHDHRRGGRSRRRLPFLALAFGFEGPGLEAMDRGMASRTRRVLSALRVPRRRARSGERSQLDGGGGRLRSARFREPARALCLDAAAVGPPTRGAARRLPAGLG